MNFSLHHGPIIFLKLKWKIYHEHIKTHDFSFDRNSFLTYY